MKRRIMKVGIMSRKDYARRTIAIARGDYIPARNEPKIWFESLKSLAEVLGERNRELLRLIEERQPQSLQELEVISNRKKSNLSRTLKTLEHHGVVEIRRVGRRHVPLVRATDFQVQFGL